jgi:ubiquinone/menaquinone biosynthesis C-methylase UbiE
MGLWEKHLLPRLINVICGTGEVLKHRKDAVAGLSGSVVEIGFGSGLNVPFYPSEITTVHAVDPSLLGRKLGQQRVDASSIPITYVDLDGQNLSLADESVDSALSTFTLCTIPDADRALRELFRVLRPGGTLHFLEHGLAVDPDIARKQDRFNRFEQRVAGGCNLNRPIDLLVRQAGFEISSLKNYWLGGPNWLKPWNYLFEGVAAKPL